MTSSPNAEATRRAVLDAARECFAERGYAATSLRAIARHAGITQPLINHYFGTKQRLFEAVLLYALDQYEHVQAQQWELPPGDLRFLTRALVVLFQWLRDNQNLLRLGMWARLDGYDFGGIRDERVTQRVHAQLEALKEADILRPEVDVDMTLVAVDALFKGFWDRHAQYEANLTDHTEPLDSRFLRHSLLMLFNGLLTPAAATLAAQQLDL